MHRSTSLVNLFFYSAALRFSRQKKKQLNWVPTNGSKKSRNVCPIPRPHDQFNHLNVLIRTNVNHNTTYLILIK
jgi:hypothetical protein